jgi:hypothetical protein
VFNIPAITFYSNASDKAKLRKLAESRGITTTKLCRNIIAEWVRVNLKSEEDDEEEDG